MTDEDFARAAQIEAILLADWAVNGQPSLTDGMTQALQIHWALEEAQK